MGNCCASPLRRAIRENDFEDLRNILEDAGDASGQLIDEDTDADCCLDWLDCSRTPKSPLFTAVLMGNLKTVEILLHYGADTNLLDYRGSNVVHMAAEHNKIDMVKLLDKANPELICTPDTNGIYPIHSASVGLSSGTTGNIEVLKYIVEDSKFGQNKDNVFIKDNLGNTALMYAEKAKNSAATEYLHALKIS